MTTKVALVTGGAQGIGKAIAGQLLKDDYKVLSFDVCVCVCVCALADPGGAPSAPFPKHPDSFFFCILIFRKVAVIGGSRGACPPPKGPNSFVLTYKIFET